MEGFAASLPVDKVVVNGLMDVFLLSDPLYRDSSQHCVYIFTSKPEIILNDCLSPSFKNLISST